MMVASTPEQRFGYLVREVSALWRGVIDRRLEPLGLSASRWEPLVVLLRSGEPMTQAMLADALKIEAPSVVRLIDRLADDGWVERRQNPLDRRAYHIVLTTKARKACTEIERVLAATRAEILGVLTQREIRACIDALSRVRDQVARLAGDGAHPAARRSSR
ncbi:transcriptional regulator, MarR family [Fontimonas thermophila]|uniref:Transcriptional regulator, MarR family n=1 Tax=Fontimonas thermophila TaxID=1076937 RepID=A0A1I2J7U4_9GAMM|nr:MarR family transcriptional regulator [Fontimonas thermophila]SFF50815.1 transcriptional regulator, MarR family [Fontimonas thermophila]